ncbi:MAG: enoyl-CoA hydratase/isomerase family protein, partial [Candidatus Omnitrophica bacterium]|nr:enoyl-CoA hydratase/isomerase family protein [Candidatus Omnitrophota bacterium]
KENVFIAGVDIRELYDIRTKESALRMCEKGQELFNKIEDLPVATFAIIDGVCLGGGLELALSCDCILAVKSRKIKMGLPETRLGIYPGFGGPHRLAEKIGCKKADSLISTGNLIDLKEARRLNIVDKIILDSEKYHYQKLVKLHRNHRTGIVLPSRIELEKREREVLSEKILQEPARNSLSGFLLVSKYRKYPWLKAVTEEKPPIERCAVIGAGTMGRGIAYLISSKGGFPVSLSDSNKNVLKKAKSGIKAIYKNATQRNIMCNDEAQLKFSNISFSENHLKDADIIIESITEDISLKKALFAELESKLSQDCILATNTSCISIGELAESFKFRERALGMHFFNPAYKMKLVELIPARFTSPDTLQRAIGFLRLLGSIPIVVKDSPGFLVNRIFLPYLNEAIFMLEEGFLPGDIESSMLEFGMPMGPFQLLKEIGSDVVYKASKILEDNFGSRMKVPGRVKKDCKRKVSSAEAITERLLFPMRREAELCLEESVVNNREIIDLALLLGIGFPSSKRIWESDSGL